MRLLTSGRALPALPAAAMPFSQTACAEGVDLNGQTIRFYHLLDPSNQVDTADDSVQSSYADYGESISEYRSNRE